ncbi:hypothetical protein Tco_0572501 [Tanacetum coccineum]
MGILTGVSVLRTLPNKLSVIASWKKVRFIPMVYNDGVQVQQVYSGGTVSGSEMHPSATSESTERPKLKLLLRSKPVETLEPLVAYNKTILQSANPVVADI